MRSLETHNDFGTWKLQFLAYCKLKNIEESRIKDVIATFVSEEILQITNTWDDRATSDTVFQRIHRAWQEKNRPSNPIASFESITYTENLTELRHTIKKAAAFINANEETQLRKFISVLPQSLKMAACQYIEGNYTIPLNALVQHLKTLPNDDVYATSSQSSTPSIQGIKNHADISAPASRSHRSAIICFNCGGPNHISRNCTAPRRYSSSSRGRWTNTSGKSGSKNGKVSY